MFLVSEARINGAAARLFPSCASRSRAYQWRRMWLVTRRPADRAPRQAPDQERRASGGRTRHVAAVWRTGRGRGAHGPTGSSRPDQSIGEGGGGG